VDNSIIPVISELERIYDTLSKQFGIKHDRPIITIQTKGRAKQTLGWHWADKWERGKESISEINICAEELNKDPVETLVHEMVHYTNTCNKIDDCNNAGYHNKFFKTLAESYGLNVEKQGRHGWAHTSLKENFYSTVLKDIKINNKVFDLYRKTQLTFTAPTKMKKYRCECTTIRCATDLSAKCLKCDKHFQPQEEE
jgi:hypothetical protein